MWKAIDSVACQILHRRWAVLVSFSRQGPWKCTKPGCAAQARHDRALLSVRPARVPLAVRAPVTPQVPVPVTPQVPAPAQALPVSPAA
jgi:hypothetical protein